MSARSDEFIAATDKDIMAESLAQELPDHDDQDRSLEEMGDGPEGDHLPDEDAEDIAEAAEPEGDPKKPADPDTPADEPADEPEEEEEEPELPRDIRGMREAVFAERKARQAAEAAQRAAREEMAAERARIDRILANQQQYQQPQQQQPPPRPPMPDPVLDPEGYKAAIKQELKDEATMMRATQSFAEAYEEHGKDFEAAYVALNRLNRNDPSDHAIGYRIINSPNPAKALMKWHREQTFLREAGSDQAAYDKRLFEKHRKDPDMVKAVLADLREQRDGGPQGAPRNITRLPPSLNRARGGSSANEILGAQDNTDEALFNYAMNGNG